MRRKALRLMMTIPAVVWSARALAAPAPPVPPTVAQLSWLSGCWERRRGPLLVQEQWLEPRGGILLGMSRTTRGDSLVEYEFVRIFARDSTLVFAAQPSGQQPAEFTAYAVVDRRVVFENSAHDFPQRITYAAAAGDSLHASISGISRGQPRTVNFSYGRASCPAPGG